MSRNKVSVAALVVTTTLAILTPTGAQALGLVFSRMWFITAPEDEIASELAPLSKMELCNIWKKASDNDGMAGDKARISIGAALLTRGEDEFFCQAMGFGN